MNVRLAANQPEPESPAVRLQPLDAMHKPHPSAGQRDGLRELQPGELLAEALCQVAFAQRIELLRRIRLHRHRHEVFPIRRTLAGLRLELQRSADDTLARCQILRREKARATLGHREQRLAVDGGLEVELEEPHAALLEEALDADVVANHLARARQAAMETNLRIEQPIHRQPARLEINAEEAGEKQIRLSRLDRDARRDAPAVEIPSARVNVVLSHDAPVRHRARLALDGRDAVHELERCVRQAHSRGKSIRSGEGGSERVANLPDGELEALLARERAGDGVRGDARGSRAVFSGLLKIAFY